MGLFAMWPEAAFGALKKPGSVFASLCSESKHWWLIKVNCIEIGNAYLEAPYSIIIAMEHLLFTYMHNKYMYYNIYYTCTHTHTVCVCLPMYILMLWFECGGHRTTCGSEFLICTIRILGTEPIPVVWIRGGAVSHRAIFLAPIIILNNM